MKPFPSLILILTVALTACIARDADDMTEDARVISDDGGPYDATVNGPLDARIRRDAAPRPDWGRTVDAMIIPDQDRPDAGPGDVCARNRAEESCAENGCTWRQGSCVAVARCADVRVLNECYRAGCGWTGEECFELDDPLRCTATVDIHYCARLECHWRRPAGDDALGCWPEPAPTVQECAQPDPATCEAAGCEWTGLGCAPPNQTPCDQLDEDACGARNECVVTAAGCAIDPDAACDGLAMDDCATRVDCGVQGLICTDLPQDACPETPQWVCEQRPDCEARRPDCSDAPKGGAGGEGGVGGGGFYCESREECADDQGCVDGDCVSCDAFIGCTNR